MVPGRGAGFSVEAPEGVRFVIRSRLFTDEEKEEKEEKEEERLTPAVTGNRHDLAPG